VLVIEHLRDAIRISEAPSSAMISAARWLGAFHRRWDHDVPDEIALPAHDAALIRMWADRAQAFASDRTRSLALRDACAAITAAGARFTPEERTVIHGEFTVHNVLTRDDVIIPVDWESTARGLGEIDLAMLLERWDDAVQQSCIDAYVDGRWPAADSAAVGFSERLAWARAYVSLRWLADRKSASTRPEQSWRFDDLVDHAKELVVR
jgi:thiamine kinase-like enzyme